MALHDFTMQRWWMESLTAKISRITTILLLLLLFFLFCSIVRREAPTAPRRRTLPPSLPPSRCRKLHPKGTSEHKETWLNLTKGGHFQSGGSSPAWSWDPQPLGPHGGLEIFFFFFISFEAEPDQRVKLKDGTGINIGIDG